MFFCLTIQTIVHDKNYIVTLLTKIDIERMFLTINHNKCYFIDRGSIGLQINGKAVPEGRADHLIKLPLPFETARKDEYMNNENIENILKLVSAGFTAEQIMKLSEAPKPQEASSQDVSDTSTNIATSNQEKAVQNPNEGSSPKKDPEPEKTTDPDSGKKEPDPEPKKESSMDPQIQQMLDDQAAQIKKLQQIISNSNFGGSGNVESDPQAYLNNRLSSR